MSIRSYRQLAQSPPNCMPNLRNFCIYVILPVLVKEREKRKDSPTMTANRMPNCLEREVRLAQDGCFPVRYDLLINANNRIIGLHFYDELHAPYEFRGLSSMIAVCWRGAVAYIPAPLAINPETGNAWPTPYTYDADYDERVTAAIEGIRRLEADYQRSLNALDRSR